MPPEALDAEALKLPPASSLDEVVVPTGWLGSTFDALSVKPYLLLWSNSFAALTAVVIFIVAQNSVAHEITGNNRAVGFVVFGQGLAMLLTTPFAGVIADRLSKRALFGAIELVMGGTALFVAVLLAVDALSIYLLALAAFVFGSALAVFGPVQFAYMGELVPSHQRANASALMQVCLNATRAYAPFLAGGFLAWSLVGSAGAFLAVALLLLPASLSALRLPASPVKVSAGEGILREIALGLAYVGGEKRLLQLVANFIVVTLIGFSFFVVLPAFADDVLGAGSAGFGVLIGISAVGSLASSLVIASRVATKGANLLMAVASFAFGLTIILTGFMPTFLLACVALFFVGLASAAFHTLNGAITLRVAAPAYLGRIVAINNLAWSATNLLGLPMGLVADLTSERTVIVGVGTTVCFAVGLLALWGRGIEAID